MFGKMKLRRNLLMLGLKSLTLMYAASDAYAFELQDTRFGLSGSYGTTPRVSDQSDDGAQTDILDGPTLSFRGRYEWRNDAGDQIFLDPALTARSVPGDGELDDYTLSVFGEYRRNLPQLDRTQFRLRVGVEHNNRFSEARFNRFTAQAAFNVRHENRRTTTYTLRYRYRNQNEGNSFDGFDQNEYFAGIRHAWSFRGRALEQVAVTPYFDIRDADGENFSYTELGLRLQARYRLADDLTLTARARGYIRENDDIFSASFPVERSDRRTAVDLELRKTLRNDAEIFGSIGWDNNNSNIPVRDFSGLTYSIGFEFNFR